MALTTHSSNCRGIFRLACHQPTAGPGGILPARLPACFIFPRGARMHRHQAHEQLHSDYVVGDDDLLDPGHASHLHRRLPRRRPGRDARRPRQPL